MILILSRSVAESTTEVVIDWINALGGEVVRMNNDDLISSQSQYSIKIDSHDNDFEIEGPGIRFQQTDKVNVVWYRKWTIPYGSNAFAGITNGDMSTKLHYHLNIESTAASYALYTVFSQAHWIDHPQKHRSLFKPVMLNKAKQSGLNIPPTIVTNHKSAIIDFMNKQGRIITKCVADGIFYSLDDYDFSMYTQEVTESMIAAIPEDIIYPSLFQQMLEKKYELRIFYLDRICYPMAIFSQNDKQTKVDFRHYNVQRPNRNVPYQLPDEIETGIIKLMESLELRCGSIDMVRTTDGQYVFLEVNPIGQFGMVSGPCNYYLEKEMAKYLIEHDR